MIEKLSNELKQEYKYPPILTFFIIIASLLVWTNLYLRTYIDVDTSWLLECLDRFMAGGTYIDDFYETNPPLSFLIYLPAYPLYTYLEMDPKLSVFLTIIMYIGIADYTLLRLLQKEKIKAQDLLIIMTALLIAQSWIAGMSFALKDHLIGTFILPISLYQYRLTRGLKTGTALATSSVIIGGIAVCLKPHYALFPALFFAHRLFTTKSLLRCITTPDFWGMLIVGISYGMVIYFLTPEFLNLMPQIIGLYSVERPFPLSMRYYYVVYAIFAAISARFLFSIPSEKETLKIDLCTVTVISIIGIIPIYLGTLIARFLFSNSEQSPLKTSIYALSAFSILSMIPFLLQDKGFHYQALPTLCFGAAAAFIAIYCFAKELFKTKSDIALWIAGGMIVLIFGSILYNYKKPTFTKDQFMAVPMIDAIDELAWNRVFANYYYKHNLASLPRISNLKRGSRFGELWPLTGLTILANDEKDSEKRAEIKAKMLEVVDLMAEDMKRYKPSVILIPHYANPETRKPTRDYYEFLIKHEGFKENLENYTYHDTILFALDPNEEATEENMIKLVDQIVPHELYILKRDHSL